MERERTTPSKFPLWTYWIRGIYALIGKLCQSPSQFPHYLERGFNIRSNGAVFVQGPTSASHLVLTMINVHGCLHYWSRARLWYTAQGGGSSYVVGVTSLDLVSDPSEGFLIWFLQSSTSNRTKPDGFIDGDVGFQTQLHICPTGSKNRGSSSENRPSMRWVWLTDPMAISAAPEVLASGCFIRHIPIPTTRWGKLGRSSQIQTLLEVGSHSRFLNPRKWVSPQWVLEAFKPPQSIYHWTCAQLRPAISTTGGGSSRCRFNLGAVNFRIPCLSATITLIHRDLVQSRYQSWRLQYLAIQGHCPNYQGWR